VNVRAFPLQRKQGGTRTGKWYEPDLDYKGSPELEITYSRVIQILAAGDVRGFRVTRPTHLLSFRPHDTLLFMVGRALSYETINSERLEDKAVA
jgi:hypothetical protein